MTVKQKVTEAGDNVVDTLQNDLVDEAVETGLTLILVFNPIRSGRDRGDATWP